MPIRLSARRCFSFLPYALSFGAVWHFLVGRSFERDGIEDHFMHLGGKDFSEVAGILHGTISDRTAAPIAAKLLICRLWPTPRTAKRSWDGPFQQQIVQFLIAGHCDAAIPKLAEAVEQWNHRPGARGCERAFFAEEGFRALGALESKRADDALARLAREFPPFPKPYSASLPVYARRGWQDEVLAWMKPKIMELEGLTPENRGPEGQALLAELITSLQAIPDPAAIAFSWQLYDRRILRDHRAAREIIQGLQQRSEPVEFARQLLRRVPVCSAINSDYFDHFVLSLVEVNSRAPGSVLEAFTEVLAEARQDSQRVHWLKKAVALHAVSGTTIPSDQPLLSVLQRDQSSIRWTQAMDWPGEMRYQRVEDAGVPPSPDWFPVETLPVKILADQAVANIRSREQVLAPVFCGFISR